MAAGQNAKAFVGGSFVPAGSDSAVLSARGSLSFSAVKTIEDSYDSSPIWDGYPSAPSIGTTTNTVSGVFPNKQNDISVSWTHPGSPVLEGFNVYYRTSPSGAWTKSNTSTIGGALRTYSVGYILADTTYELKVEAVSRAGIVQETASTTSVLLSSPSAPTPSSSSSASTSITWSWTVSSGSYQSYEVQISTNNLTWGSSIPVAGHATNTSFSYELTGLSQNTTRYLRIRGKNNNGHWSSFSSSVVGTSANAAPPAPSATISSSAADIGNLQTSSSNVTRTISWTANNSSDSEFSKFEVYLRTLPAAFPSSPNFTYHTTGVRSGSFTGSPGTSYEIKVIQYDIYNATSETTASATGAAVATTTVNVGYTATLTDWEPTNYQASNTSGTSSAANALDDDNNTNWITTQFSTTTPSPLPWWRGTLEGGNPGGTTANGGRLTSIRYRTRIDHTIVICVYADGEWKAGTSQPTRDLVGIGVVNTWYEIYVPGETNIQLSIALPSWSSGNPEVYIAYKTVGTFTSGGTTFTRRATLTEVGYDWQRDYTQAETRYY